jgi:hypothetical protein
MSIFSLLILCLKPTFKVLGSRLKSNLKAVPGHPAAKSGAFPPFLRLLRRIVAKVFAFTAAFCHTPARFPPLSTDTQNIAPDRTIP